MKSNGALFVAVVLAWPLMDIARALNRIADSQDQFWKLLKSLAEKAIQ